ncbi:MFS general substrate transporter, partial [Aspergillus ellipticus CBS 707.79]
PFILSFGSMAALLAGCAAAPNIWSLLILRFIAGALGSAPLTNAGGVISDMFPARHRGLALSLFAAGPFMGPTLGPTIGGFIGMNAGWRWVEGFLATLTGLFLVIMACFVPETYAPVLLHRRAKRLSKMTGKVYRTQLEQEGENTPSLTHAIIHSLSRPWVLLFREPIVFILSIYIAFIYGTLFMMFAAFPIVYQEGRGWNQGVGGLAFMGILVGMFLAILYTVFDNKRYLRAVDRHGRFAPPECRFPPVLLASICVPVGLFWFAWTNYPSIYWLASVAAGVPFGFGLILIYLGTINYLVDSYTIYAASVLAANTVMRSTFGAIFPLFTTYMYDALGIHWASSVTAFLTAACLPFPFIFYRYGHRIREKCKYAAESKAYMEKIQQSVRDEDE